MARKKLLIIVGGGIYGCVPAHFLGSLPEGLDDLNKVDCLAGCSIGGILATAYAAGHPFRYMDGFFRKHAKDFFVKRFCAKINPLACPTYDNRELDKVFKPIYGWTTMEDTRSRFPKLDLFIPTLNLTDDKYKVFDNISNEDRTVFLKDIAGMTSAAPSYFGGREFNGKCFIDGGLIEVAPLITAATALKSKRNIPFKDMDVLMIGTGKDIDDKPITFEDYEDMGLFGLALKVIVPYATLANELATEYWGRNMGFHSFEYYNPCQHNGKLDDVSQIPDLVKQCDKHRTEFIDKYEAWLNG